MKPFFPRSFLPFRRWQQCTAFEYTSFFRSRGGFSAENETSTFRRIIGKRKSPVCDHKTFKLKKNILLATAWQTKFIFISNKRLHIWELALFFSFFSTEAKKRKPLRFWDEEELRLNLNIRRPFGWTCGPRKEYSFPLASAGCISNRVDAPSEARASNGNNYMFRRGLSFVSLEPPRRDEEWICWEGAGT